MTGSRRTLVLLVVMVALTVGCQQMRKMGGIRTDIQEPAQDTPEWVVHQAVQAAMNKDEALGWETFRGLLHSKQLESPASEQNWRSMNFSTMRRKVPLYLPDDSVATYRLCYKEEPRDGAVKVFVENEKNPENCTPCQVERDAVANNAWRIMHCSL